jgi:GDPmannose 4,6-dehydratase
MLQHEKPDDFVLATGEAHTVKDFLDEAEVDYVRAPQELRPNDLNYLCGDYSKAKELLNWEPKIRFKQLVSLMVEADLAREGRHISNKSERQENKIHETA